MVFKVYNWLNTALNGLYPPTCLLCGTTGHAGRDLCAGCHADLPFNRDCCSRCALPLPADRPRPSLCGACQKKPPLYQVCHAAFRYEGQVPQLVAGLKFHGRLSCGRLLGQYLAQALQERQAERPELILPVPLHRTRLQDRGYNQAVEIAREVGHALRIPVDPARCVRKLATPPQTGLEQRERRRNLRGAFDLSRPVRAGHVAVLDDVVTTGSTVTELTRLLKRAGVGRIDVWAVARTA